MNQPKKQKILKVMKIVFIIVIFYLILKFLIPALNTEQVKNLVISLGPLGPAFIIIYIAISHILAPLTGTPGVLLCSTIFGVSQTVIYVYLGGLISAAVNFWISRKLGRKWIIKLAGQKTMREIDDFVKVSGVKILIIGRLLGFALFEIISYAVGLTNISFKKYFWITAVFSAVPAFIFGYLFRNQDLQSPQALMLWLGAIIITGLIFAFFIKKFIFSQNSKNN